MTEETDELYTYTPVWILRGLIGRTPASLELEDGRVRLTSEDIEVFNVPLDEIRDVNFPWYNFGAGMKIRVGAQEYRLSFTEPGEYGSISEGRSGGKTWKRILLSD